MGGQFVSRLYDKRRLRLRPGQRVVTTAGCRMAGVVAPRHFRRDEWTDGTYRYPEPGENTVPVVWDDGTCGWAHAAYLAREPIDENRQTLPAHK